MIDVIATEGVSSDRYIGMGMWVIAFLLMLSFYFLCKYWLKDKIYADICLATAVWTPLIGLNEGQPEVQIVVTCFALYFSKDIIKSLLLSFRDDSKDDKSDDK